MLGSRSSLPTTRSASSTWTSNGTSPCRTVRRSKRATAMPRGGSTFARWRNRKWSLEPSFAGWSPTIAACGPDPRGRSRSKLGFDASCLLALTDEAVTVLLREHTLANAICLRGDLEQLVVGEELDG